MNRIGVVVNQEKSHAGETAERFIAACRQEGVEALRLEGDDVTGLEGLIGVGGDGTVLQAAATAMDAGVPIAGINVGRVGYLAEFEVDEIDTLAKALASDRLSVVSRMTIDVEHEGATATAVNDVVLEKAKSERIIEIAVTIGGHEFTTYRADGVIVATPVGSTAYSLSAGGPVVDPDVDAMVLTPVAPHSLLSRSLVLATSTDVRLEVAIDRPARVNVDGREMTAVAPGASITVREGRRRIGFLTLGRHPFPTAVRHQFGLDHA